MNKKFGSKARKVIRGKKKKPIVHEKKFVSNFERCKIFLDGSFSELERLLLADGYNVSIIPEGTIEQNKKYLLKMNKEITHKNIIFFSKYKKITDLWFQFLSVYGFMLKGNYTPEKLKNVFLDRIHVYNQKSKTYGLLLVGLKKGYQRKNLHMY